MSIHHLTNIPEPYHRRNIKNRSETKNKKALQNSARLFKYSERDLNPHSLKAKGF